MKGFECKNQSNHLEGRKVSQRVHENSKYKQANCLTWRNKNAIDQVAVGFSIESDWLSGASV